MGMFLLSAAAMLAVALVFVLVPLLRRRDTAGSATAEARRLLDALNSAHANGILSDAEYAAKRVELGDKLVAALDSPSSTRSSSAFYAALAVALLLPAGAILMYRQVGTPGAIDGTARTEAPADHGQNMEQAIEKLADKLKQNPQDVEGWVLLGRAYESTQRFEQARDAMKHAIDLAPNDADVTVAYAEVLALSSPDRRLDGEPLRLIQDVLKKSPDNERALWLFGISQYQQKKFNDAIATWNHLVDVLPKDSDTARSVKMEIAKAEAARDGKEPPPDESMADQGDASAQSGNAAPTDDASGPHLTVKVSLDPKLQDKLAPDDTLFVYAKAANGPPMPLAIQRLSAKQLPTTITLTDGMGMMPSMKLSQFPQVIVGARISKSGNAIAQSGDLQTVTHPIDVHTTDPIALTIDQVVP